MLRENKADLMPFFTESGVHHLVFCFRSRDLIVQGFDVAHSLYLDEYKPIPFEYQEIESEPPMWPNGKGGGNHSHLYPPNPRSQKTQAIPRLQKTRNLEIPPSVPRL